MVDEYEVVDGDSYWGIAERFLPAGSPARDVWEFTQALMSFNAPRLGYAHPAMLHPGDVVDIVAPAATAGHQQRNVGEATPVARRRRRRLVLGHRRGVRSATTPLPMRCCSSPAR